MNHHRSAAVISAFYLLYIAMTATAYPPYSHNITAILAEDPRFTTFNHHLTSTGLADVINTLTEVTVCAMDNAAMSELLSLNPSQTSLRRLLLFHLFSHYSDAAEYLNSCCAWTLYPRPSGVGNEVVDLTEIDGKVSFTFPFTSDYSQLLGFIKLIPPHLSVLHVSNVLPSPEAWSLKSPIDTLKIMAESGCGAFAGAVAEVAAADRFLRENAYVGMTVLCPIDGAWERFSPRFREMEEEEKAELLLFHAFPVYHRRCEIKGWMGPWREALTSYYRGNGGFGEPMVKMEAVRKLIVGVGYDDEGPLAVYPMRGVLLPDDPVGVMEYLDPVKVPVKVKMEEDCVDPVFLAMPPAPEPSEVADSDLVENIASLQLAS